MLKIKLNNKTLGALYAVAMTAVGTGCVTSQQQQPVYDGYLDPNAKDFAVQREAFQNAGKVVEATFVKDANGNTVAVYGVRDRTCAEGAVNHLNKYAPLYDMGKWAVDKAIDGTRLGYEIKGVHTLEELNATERKQTYFLNGINNSLLQQSSSSKSSSCGR